MKAGPAPQITLRWLAMKGPLGATIDQIEPGKGYTRRNTQLVTHCGNGFKGGMTMRETRQLRRQILGVLAALLLLAAIDPAAAQTPAGWNGRGPFIAYGRARPVYVAPPSFKVPPGMFGPPRVAITVGPSALDQPGLNAVHNGSLMTMFANPDTGDLVINYALPRPDLLGLVGPGTTLVRGRWSGDVFVGEARVFSRYCGAVPYPVRGSVDQSNALMLFGPAPQFDTACNVIGFDINSRNAVLRFEPEGPQ